MQYRGLITIILSSKAIYHLMSINITRLQDRAWEVIMMNSIGVVLCFKAERPVSPVADAPFAYEGCISRSWEVVTGVKLDSWLIAVDLQITARWRVDNAGDVVQILKT